MSQTSLVHSFLQIIRTFYFRREKEREGESEIDRDSVCMCLRERERARERESEKEREREREGERERDLILGFSTSRHPQLASECKKTTCLVSELSKHWK